MKNRVVSRFSVLALAVGLVCLSVPIGSFAESGPFKVLVNFAGTNGSWPYGDLIQYGENLYGMTSLGGAYLPSGNSDGCGTIFEFNTQKGKLKTLYSFGSVANQAAGANPNGDLIEYGENLYGMTNDGGANGNYGTIFKFNTQKGKLKTLYSFGSEANQADGASPYGSLIQYGENLYGMTSGGGANGDYGTIFKFNTQKGKLKTLYSFGSKANQADGAAPRGSLIQYGENLYGMTEAGGANEYGTIFKFNTQKGKLKILHSFGSKANQADGAVPRGSLIQYGENLYGMTYGGGAKGCGTIFKFNTPKGKLKILYSFGSEANDGDGAYPWGGLMLLRSTLYGVTCKGGTDTLGVIFSYTLK